MPKLVIRFIASYLIIASHLWVSAPRERNLSSKIVLVEEQYTPPSSEDNLSCAPLLLSCILRGDPPANEAVVNRGQNLRAGRIANLTKFWRTARTYCDKD